MTPPRATPAAPAPPVAALDVDALLIDPGTALVLCCGAGGVGKTTTSAAVAVRAAEAGRRVVVLTIDPARRLAQSLGLTELDNNPRPVAGVDTARGGSLDAMMLDMKRTFDDVVTRNASPESARTLLANPFYRTLSTSFSGTQEYMAMEKLGQLHAEALRQGAGGRWDLIVVDTPPARSAMDFLDAPERVGALLDGRFLRLLLNPSRGPLRLMSLGVTVVSTVMDRVLGSQVLTDVQTFVRAFETLFSGFRTRAEATRRLLSSAQTRFLVVATPQLDALREAAYFVDRLSREGMPLAGLVVNRLQTTGLDLPAEVALAAVEDLAADAELEREALRRHARRREQVTAEAVRLDRFAASRPAVAQARVQSLPTDVTDLDALRRVGDLLAAG